MTFTDQPNGVTAMAGAAEVIEFEATLPVLIERASRTLLDARSSAEVLEARDMARVAYDAAKSAGRLEKAKEARDEVLAAIYRAQAQASEIETRAKARRTSATRVIRQQMWAPAWSSHPTPPSASRQS